MRLRCPAVIGKVKPKLKSHAAERLDTVEQDLIRTLAQGNHVDPGTKRLLAEMRVCTDPLLGEFSDIGRDQPAA